MNVGNWAFWEGVGRVKEVNGVRLFEKDGLFAVCPPGVEPGDADSFLTWSEELSKKWFEQEVNPDSEE